jgi:NAD(P)-dependent dehydrogenase (short-subunit alcohol dehydrogenase family)
VEAIGSALLGGGDRIGDPNRAVGDPMTDGENEMPGVLIVTGGSRGIGAAIATCAGARQWKVCVNYRAGEVQANTVVEAIRAEGGTAIAVKADVSDESEVEQLFAEVDDRLGTVSALVNNAGIDEQMRVADITRQHLERVFAVNAFGPYYCSREAVRRMSTARGGRGGVIVNISSISPLYGGMPGDAVYAGSKGAVDALTLALAREVAHEGIRVCGVRPGMTATEMWDEGDVPLEEVLRSAHSLVPLGRMATPEDIAEAVLWLCSEQASYVTATSINVSGGRETYVRSSSD